MKCAYCDSENVDLGCHVEGWSSDGDDEYVELDLNCHDCHRASFSEWKLVRIEK